MKPSLDEYASLVKGLAEKVKELEARLAALEVRDHAARAENDAHPEDLNIFNVPAPPSAAAPLPASHPLSQFAGGGSANAMPVIGKVFLGLAGAYLLRAVAESGALPQITVAAVALIYSAGWLVWGTGRSSVRFASGAYGLTASLIVFPLLWESTVRFKLLPASVTAVVLVAFALLAFVVAWKKDLAAVASLTTSFAAFTSFALCVSTGNPAPFITGLLLISACAEYACARGRWPAARIIAAVAADAGVLMLIVLYTGQELSPQYVPLATPVLLALIVTVFLLSIVSTLFTTIIRQRPIAYFSVLQTTVTFLVATWGTLRASHDAAQPWIGALCIVGAAIGYLAAFMWFDEDRLTRNYHVFATWAAALLVSGTFLVLPARTASSWFSLAALVAIAAAVRNSRLTLAMHSLSFLTIAWLSSGLLIFVVSALAGSRPQPASWPVTISAAASVAIWLFIRRSGTKSHSAFTDQCLQFCFSMFCVAALISLASSTTQQFFAFPPPALAAVRTFLICAAALLYGLASSRQRTLAYVLMSLCTVKLLFEDLHTGNAASIAFSLSVYGFSWVLLPRVVRSDRPSKALEGEKSKVAHGAK
jgi:hypothetical protein